VWRGLELFAIVFTQYNCLRAAAMQAHISGETRVDCDKMKKSSAQIFIPYESMFSLDFRHEEWLVGHYLKFWAS